MTAPQEHALYRFYDSSDQLLYVGITLDPGKRWKQHRDDKPWWTDVATVRVETYPDRATVLDAERAAIIAEHPRHNVVHNRRLPNGGTATMPQLTRISPVQVGDWVALMLEDGRCPVGAVSAIDDTWVSIRLKEFLMGGMSNEIEVVRWAEVKRISAAYPEDAEKGKYGTIMDDGHLGEWQTAWKRHHFGPEGRDPVGKLRMEYMQECRAMERGA